MTLIHLHAAVGWWKWSCKSKKCTHRRESEEDMCIQKGKFSLCSQSMCGLLSTASTLFLLSALAQMEKKPADNHEERERASTSFKFNTSVSRVHNSAHRRQWRNPFLTHSQSVRRIFTRPLVSLVARSSAPLQ